jgi:hypothetical protein
LIVNLGLQPLAPLLARDVSEYILKLAVRAAVARWWPYARQQPLLTTDNHELPVANKLVAVGGRVDFLAGE